MNLIKKNLGFYFLCLNLFYFSFPFPIDLFLVYFVNVPGLNGKKQTIKINRYTGIWRNSALSHAGSCFFPALIQSAPPKVSNKEWSRDPAVPSVPPQLVHPTSGDLETQQGRSPEMSFTSSSSPHFQSHSPLGQEKNVSLTSTLLKPKLFHLWKDIGFGYTGGLVCRQQNQSNRNLPSVHPDSYRKGL